MRELRGPRSGSALALCLAAGAGSEEAEAVPGAGAGGCPGCARCRRRLALSCSDTCALASRTASPTLGPVKIALGMFVVLIDLFSSFTADIQLITCKIWWTV